MKESEFVQVVRPFLCNLWQSWQITDAENQAWQRALGPYSLNAAKAAIEEVWQDDADAYKPPVKHIIAACKRHQEHAPKSEDQQRYEDAFYGADKLTQTRMIVQSIRLRLARDDFGGRSRGYWEAALALACKQERRLCMTPEEREAYWKAHQEKFGYDPRAVRPAEYGRKPPREPKLIGALVSKV